MFERKPVLIDSEQRVFISSRPDTEKDIAAISRLGITRVIFYGGYPGVKEADWEKERLQKRGIRVVLIANSSGGVPFETDCVRVLGEVSRNTLIHCWKGGSAQVIGAAYWVLKGGLEPEKARTRFVNALKRANVRPSILLANHTDLLNSLYQRHMAAMTHQRALLESQKIARNRRRRNHMRSLQKKNRSRGK